MENKQMKKVYPILLGCDKNRVDLEKIIFSLQLNGYIIVDDINDCDIALIQTCAFILPARKEAIENILYCVDKKNKGIIEKIVVSGCFPQKNLDELKVEFPEVDAFILIRDYPIIANIFNSLYTIQDKVQVPKLWDRILTNEPHYAYLKIADGCDNCCAYCTIPRIRGRYKSIPIDDVLKEAQELVKNGVKELIIVAQDTTRYGIDLYGEVKIVELLDKLSKIKDLEWIRIHYCYPEMLTNDLLNIINSNNKICKYIDIPLQHIDDYILKEMNRKSSEESIINLLKNIRTNYSEIRIRSTFIVGFPYETKKRFKKLLSFLKEYKLDMVGFFPYSREEKTKAYFMRHQIPEFIKKIRLKKAQNVQDNIFNINSSKYLDNTYKCIIDYFDESDGYYVCRNEFFSPDVDFIIKVNNNDNLIIGKFYNVKINSYNNGIFYGEVINEYTK